MQTATVQKSVSVVNTSKPQNNVPQNNQEFKFRKLEKVKEEIKMSKKSQCC